MRKDAQVLLAHLDTSLGGSAEETLRNHPGRGSFRFQNNGLPEPGARCRQDLIERSPRTEGATAPGKSGTDCPSKLSFRKPSC